MKTTGLIHIYTGDGKGKTTAAVGLACRALGSGLRVGYVSFHKRPELYGYAEMQSLKTLGATILNLAKGHPHLDSTIDASQLVIEVKEGLKQLADRLVDEQFDLLILDEILISVRDKYLSEADLIAFMRNKPEHLELVMTGRGASQNLQDMADYVSYVQKIKHPYDQSITSRKGIEY